jgi:hypothetical protein
MSSIGGITQNLQALAPSYAPLGKPAAGLESPENKDQALPPVEETSAGDKNRNQPNQKADAVSSDSEDGRKRNREQPAEQIEAEREQGHEPTAADSDTRTYEAAYQAAGGALQIALQRAAALHGESNKSNVGGGNIADNFSAAAGHTLEPGSLLDQRS